jgi:uncharacterized protein
MNDLVAILLLISASIAGLLLIPFGLPGLWVIVLGVLGYGWATEFRSIGVGLIVLAVGLALLGEIVESWLGFRLARRYGGSSRAGWGALVGVPVPLIGSVIGGFVGAFLGAALFEYTRGRQYETAAKAGWGAVLGRAAAAAVKIGLGIVIAVSTLFQALRG